ncbi:hypothetical protein PVAND_015348 [Polypedilum vanderplanki]|uniref:Uncharacterized protein n=1 Tax=Polypedilum vanderplanki TaxID=319348 RepID=A0A9J6BCC5_POLVA|nr:hypothetical protein PVAND_015348 [Polypedilum vanderplanki]
MITSRNIKNIKINFGIDSPASEHEKVLEIFTKTGQKLKKVTLSGEIDEAKLIEILKCIPNCKSLIFDNLKSIQIEKLTTSVTFNHLINFEVKNKSHSHILKHIKFGNDCLKTLICRRRRRGNEIVKNQKNLVEVSLRTRQILSEDFLLDCKLKKLSLDYNASEMNENSYINFIQNHTHKKNLKF